MGYFKYPISYRTCAVPYYRGRERRAHFFGISGTRLAAGMGKLVWARGFFSGSKLLDLYGPKYVDFDVGKQGLLTSMTSMTSLTSKCLAHLQ